MSNDYRSDLSKAKNLGASGSGSHHWWHQRFTAIVIALTVFWVFYFFAGISDNQISGIIDLLQRPINSIMLIIFSIFTIYHGMLGMQVIIEDYVHCRILRLSMIVTIKIFAILTIITFIMSILFLIKL